MTSESTPLDLDATVQRASDTVDASIDDEVVTMSIASGNYFVMDPIAARIWALLEEPVTIARLVDQLTQEYDVAIDQCRHDVIAFLGDLLEKGIVRRVV